MHRRLLALSFGNFVIGTGAMIMTGMVTVMADDLGTSPAAIGQLFSAFALTICIAGPFLGGSTSRIDRRTLLSAVLVLFAVGHLLAALMPGYWSLMAVRVATAFAGTLFTPQAAATAGLLVTPAERGRAIAFVFLGWSVAAVIGTPSGAWIGAHWGWRSAMGLVGLLSLVGAGLIWWSLPRDLFVARVDRAAWQAVGRHPVLLPIVSITAIHSTAQFALMTYLAVAFRDALGASPELIALLLMVFGIMGMTGNVISGRLADRYGAATMVNASLLALIAAFSLWPLIYHLDGTAGIVLTGAVMALWGWGCFAGNSMQQVRLVALAPALAPVSVALNSSAIYFGQFAGAATGGVVLRIADSSWLSWFGWPVLILALGVSLQAQRRTPPNGELLAKY